MQINARFVKNGHYYVKQWHTLVDTVMVGRVPAIKIFLKKVQEKLTGKVLMGIKVFWFRL